jgi:hypothetical protein
MSFSSHLCLLFLRYAVVRTTSHRLNRLAPKASCQPVLPASVYSQGVKIGKFTPCGGTFSVRSILVPVDVNLKLNCSKGKMGEVDIYVKALRLLWVVSSKISFSR